MAHSFSEAGAEMSTKPSWIVVEDTNKGDFYSSISGENPTHSDSRVTNSVYRIICKTAKKDICILGTFSIRNKLRL